MKRYIPIFIIFILVLGVVLIEPGLAMGEGRLQFGNFLVSPGVAVVGEHNDNIYLGNGENNTTEREESDWITHVKPQLLTQFMIPGRGYIGLGYKGDAAYYSDYDDNDWQSHTGLLDCDYQSPAGLLFGGRHQYIATEDPYGSDTEYKAGIALTERVVNISKWQLGFKTPDMFKVLVYYNYYKQDYDNDLLDYSQDYRDNEFGCGLRIRAGAKTWAFLRWFRGDRDYYSHPISSPVNDATDADYKWQRVNMGLLWDSEARLSGELNIGYKEFDHDNDTVGLGGVPYEDDEGWIAATSITYQVADQTAISLELANDFKHVGSDTSNYYENTRFGAQLSQVFLERLQLAIGGEYSRSDYYQYSRDDKNYTVFVDFDYQIYQWLTASAGYVYKEKTASTNNALNRYGDLLEYAVNRYTVKLSAVF